MSDAGRAGRESATDWSRLRTSGAALSPPPGAEWTDAWMDGAGVRLHAVHSGTGAPVVLLHGFPDFWHVWRRQLPALAAAGFHAIAPDLRGYNLSERPRRVEDYRRDLLADDVAALIHGIGVARAHVVGHDWGGVVAWHLAVRHPDVVDQLAICNAPHPARYRQLLRTPAQARRAWYAALFLLPWLPERLLGARDLAPLRRIWRYGPRARGATSDADLAASVAAFREPAARWAAVSYYRALVRHRATVPPERRRIPHRTLLIWGAHDVALVRANAEGLEPWVPDLRVLDVPEAGHWVMLDAPTTVSAALIAFLRAPSVSAA
ncbi:MAG: alpha/beta fold hydrolase [Gemmatirosa sp.]